MTPENRSNPMIPQPARSRNWGALSDSKPAADPNDGNLLDRLAYGEILAGHPNGCTCVADAYHAAQAPAESTPTPDVYDQLRAVPPQWEKRPGSSGSGFLVMDASQYSAGVAACLLPASAEGLAWLGRMRGHAGH